MSALLTSGSAPLLSSVETVTLAATSPIKSPVDRPVRVTTVVCDAGRMVEPAREMIIDADVAKTADADPELLNKTAILEDDKKKLFGKFKVIVPPSRADNCPPEEVVKENVAAEETLPCDRSAFVILKKSN